MVAPLLLKPEGRGPPLVVDDDLRPCICPYLRRSKARAVPARRTLSLRPVKKAPGRTYGSDGSRRSEGGAESVTIRVPPGGTNDASLALIWPGATRRRCPVRSPG